MLRRRLGALLCTVAVAGTLQTGKAAVSFDATCVITLQATFNPPLTMTATTTTLDFFTPSSTCAGTEILKPAFIGGTATATMSCTRILVLAGTGAMTYGSAPPGGFDFILVGTAAAMEMVLTPGTGDIVGSATLVPVPVALTSCNGGGVGTVRLTGSFTFIDP